MSFVVWKFNQLSLPLEFGSSVLTVGTARLYFHAHRIMAALIVAMVVARYWSLRAKTPASSATVYILAGVARGVSAHFLRDVATAPISPRWPVTKATVLTVLAVRAGASCHHRYSVGKIPRERC